MQNAISQKDFKKLVVLESPLYRRLFSKTLLIQMTHEELELISENENSILNFSADLTIVKFLIAK